MLNVSYSPHQPDWEGLAWWIPQNIHQWVFCITESIQAFKEPHPGARSNIPLWSTGSTDHCQGTNLRTRWLSQHPEVHTARLTSNELWIQYMRREPPAGRLLYPWWSLDLLSPSVLLGIPGFEVSSAALLHTSQFALWHPVHCGPSSLMPLRRLPFCQT